MTLAELRGRFRRALQILRYGDQRADLDPRFGGEYEAWRDRRIAAIEAHFGTAWFAEKQVVEVGAGHGDIGAHFARLGAHVTCLEGREENLAVLRQRHPSLRAQQADLDGRWPLAQPCDLVLHLGLLYHLPHPEESLRLACAAAPQIVLDTEVCDTMDPHWCMKAAENPGQYDQSLSGVGSRPSVGYVERIFTECGMRFERLEDGSIDSPGRPGFVSHLYAWPITESYRYGSGWRKFWFAHRM